MQAQNTSSNTAVRFSSEIPQCKLTNSHRFLSSPPHTAALRTCTLLPHSRWQRAGPNTAVRFSSRNPQSKQAGRNPPTHLASPLCLHSPLRFEPAPCTPTARTVHTNFSSHTSPLDPQLHAAHQQANMHSASPLRLQTATLPHTPHSPSKCRTQASTALLFGSEIPQRKLTGRNPLTHSASSRHLQAAPLPPTLHTHRDRKTRVSTPLSVSSRTRRCAH
jgi:hypothetical protein